MNDLISRQAAIDAVFSLCEDCDSGYCGPCRVNYPGEKDVINVIRNLPPTQPENQVHLCDSCRYVYPECPSGKDDVIYGNGKGNDNICACNKYEPSEQPEQRRGEES